CSWSTRSPPFKTFLQEIINVARAVEKGDQLPWNKEVITECRDNARSTFIEYIYPFIEENPDTEFFFFFHPIQGFGTVCRSSIIPVITSPISSLSKMLSRP
ncbi:MAG: hypothetical protein D3909_14340, partial [Candidatus Electrothrix sp. ATG1]|nr:hypothetical protein [Candidatus Electrothrix sp. ATG1]